MTGRHETLNGQVADLWQTKRIVVRDTIYDHLRFEIGDTAANIATNSHAQIPGASR